MGIAPSKNRHEHEKRCLELAVQISRAEDGTHGFSRESVRRILTFAVPYRAKLVIFIALSVVGAFLAVATPVLAGQVVNVIVVRSAFNTIVWLAVVIALVAVAEAAVSRTRWYSARIEDNMRQPR
ncbi:hypothetical protein [Agreia sp. Leaf244]|uniref:hypothetical protein n=1 Tax=Agreia sp. Leaf244 TaxID=1736305 RepID=UPI001F1A742D|nr:hypothetical protein [Agreia sp. Leaf244]